MSLLMKIKISNIKIPVTSKIDLKFVLKERFGFSDQDILDFKILRLSVDARKKDNVVYDYQVYLNIPDSFAQILKNENVSIYEPPKPIEYGEWKYKYPPVVVGFGPAGMFAALYLARCHAKPVIIERGAQIEQRKSDVQRFFDEKILDENSNVQFGEGGAGAFSDGKLATNIHSEWIGFVLEEFYKHGASEDVTYSSNPHVGTDYLEIVVRNIREEIKSLGGTFHFNRCFSDFSKNEDGITLLCKDGFSLVTEHCLLCLGHSAKDTIKQLYAKGLNMEAKSFSMGVRVEHKQSLINQIQYGKFAQFLPNASYKGVVHLKTRDVYVFCMCPGGKVMASASENSTIVTNGMSYKRRDGENANSALLVNVDPKDFYKNSPLDGLDFQEKYEKLAFEVGKDYRAPCNLMKEFLASQVAKSCRTVRPSYPHGVVFCDFTRCLPTFVVNSLRAALPVFNTKMKGFTMNDAILIGIESRSSSPVRILRDDGRQSNIAGFFPVGEGAGYAGGITSAAVDGLKTAYSIIKKEATM